jgi:hypothetical protein
MAGSGSGVDRPESLRLWPERVAGEGIAELGHGAEIAGVQFGDFDGLAALHDGEMGEAAPDRGGCSSPPWRRFDDAAEHFEEGDAAGEGIGHGLEDEQAAGSLSSTLRIVASAASSAALPFAATVSNDGGVDAEGSTLDGRGQ